VQRSVAFSSLYPNILTAPFWNTRNVCYSLDVRDQVSHQYKKQVKLLLSILISVVLDGNTEGCGRVVNTPALYSGGSVFTSWPGERLSWLRLFVVFLGPLRRMLRDNTLAKAASFQIFSYLSFTYSPSILRYIILVTERASLTNYK
jgi:hypothetical protein